MKIKNTSFIYCLYYNINIYEYNYECINFLYNKKLIIVSKISMKKNFILYFH